MNWRHNSNQKKVWLKVWRKNYNFLLGKLDGYISHEKKTQESWLAASTTGRNFSELRQGNGCTWQKSAEVNFQFPQAALEWADSWPHPTVWILCISYVAKGDSQR